MATSERVGRARSRRLPLVLLSAPVGLVVLVALASVAEHARYRGHVLPGVQVDGLHVGGDNDTAAHDAIARLAADLERTSIRANAGTRTFEVTPAVVDFVVDVDATTRRAREAGRGSNPFALVGDTVLRRFRPDHVPLVVHYDDASFQGLLDGWANALRVGLVDGGLRFEGTKVVEIMPRAGTGLERDEAARRLRHALESATRTDLELPIGAIAPSVDQAAVDAAAVRARTLLATDHTIVAGGTTFTITPPQLATMLGTRIAGHALDLTLDRAKLTAALGPVFAALMQPPVDATFTVASDNTVSVVPSRDGNELDVAALEMDLLSGKLLVTARIRNAHPKHDTAWAQGLGITMKVSSFTTHHLAGQPRVHNIHLAADALNNAVVEPGQLFSLNGRLGPRTPQKGYVKAPILVEDGFGEDFGGGVSQLTTTLYNAVFFGGYEDVEHSPHHFYITRYPMGREATINYPSIDLRFRDDTSHGVLIRTSYSSTSITVTLYGNNDGRTVREDGRKILATVPITDDLVKCPVKDPKDDPKNDCATLTLLQKKTIVTGETGYDVEFNRVIDQPGRPELRQHYRVHYPMLPNKVLVGITPPTTTTAPKSVGHGSTTTTRPPPKTTTTATTIHHP